MSTLICPGQWEKLLVCSDGSPASQGAVTGALALAQACGSRVYALHVVEVNPVFEAQVCELIRRLEGEFVEPIKAEAVRLGVNLEARVRRSLAPHAAIVEEAEGIQPDLIIMGRHGKGGLARLMLGSVTARVIGLSPFKVLVVPREAILAFNRLLIASDGSPCSEAAWEEALSMTRMAGSRLLAVAVARDEAEFPMMLELVDRLMAAAHRQGLPVETQMLQGEPDDAIVQAALKNEVDLILLGSHGRTGLKKLLLGSVTGRVIGQAPCPVLVVKVKD
jgi:nucleotide-binding universal stress UspA family protein